MVITFINNSKHKEEKDISEALPLAVGRYGDWVKYLPTAILTMLLTNEGYMVMRAIRK